MSNHDDNQIPLFGHTDSAYTSEQLSHLKGVEMARKRPEFFGITDREQQGLLSLINEVLDNGLDEVSAGHGTLITVEIENDGTVCIQDDGRGIPIDISQEHGVPAIEILFTELFSGGKFEEGAYLASGGLHGLGLKCVNAFSTWLEVDVWRDGYHHRITFENGIVKSPLERLEPSSITGTRLRFRPDYENFFLPGTVVPAEAVTRRLRTAAYLNPGLTTSIIYPSYEETFHYPDGVCGYIDEVSVPLSPIHEETIRLTAATDDFSAEAYFRFVNGIPTVPGGFVNNIHTLRGGSHVDALISGVFEAIKTYGSTKKLSKKKDPDILPADVAKGLLFVVSLRTKNVSFSSQGKDCFRDPETGRSMASLFSEHMALFLAEHPALATDIFNHCLSHAEHRERTAQQKRQIRKLKSTMSEGIPPSLHASESTGENSQLFVLVAASSSHKISAARDPDFQALIPLNLKHSFRGEDNLDDLLNNKDILSLVGAIGAGVGVPDEQPEESERAPRDEDGNFNLSERRYDTVVIVPDGNSESRLAASQLARFFQMQMPALVETGKLFLFDSSSLLTTTGHSRLWQVPRSTLSDSLFATPNPLWLPVVEFVPTEAEEFVQPANDVPMIEEVPEPESN